MGRLVARELAEKVVNFTGLHVFGQARDEEGPDLVVGGVGDEGRSIRMGVERERMRWREVR